MNKYKILKDQYIEAYGKKLYRILALKDLNGVKSGDIGGYIEKESNLSQSDDAWVYGNALVCGNARVCGNALVYGDARVYGNARVYSTRHYLNLGPIGSRNGQTAIYRDKSKKAIVVCGCFSGNLEDFERSVHKTHTGTKYEAEYMALIQLARLREKEWMEEESLQEEVRDDGTVSK